MACVGLCCGELRESKQLEWKIADFFSLSTEKSIFYVSPSFVFNNTSLCLSIYPGGNTHAKSGFLSVYLRNAADCTLHVNNTLHIKKADGTFIGGGSKDVFLKSSMGYTNFYHRSDLEQNKSQLVPSGILTIICILEDIKDGKQAIVQVENLLEEQTIQTSDHQSLMELDALSENLRYLSTDTDSCDVVLQVEDKEFKAHKAILMARSSVFAAMFKHDTLEKQTGFVKVIDCDSESFPKFLEYLYSGKLQVVSFRSAFHLYIISDKYDVQKLKEFCAEYLIECLTTENVCNVIKLADKYDEIKLLTVAQNFFTENFSKIFLTSEWESLLKDDYRLANKLLIEMSKIKGTQ